MFVLIIFSSVWKPIVLIVCVNVEMLLSFNSVDKSSTLLVLVNKIIILTIFWNIQSINK